MTEEQVFLAAVDLPNGADRAAYLDEVCGQNSERRRQIEDLIAAHERSGQFLDEAAAEQMAAGPQSPTAPTVALNAEGDDAMADSKKTNASPSDDGADDLQFLSPSTRPDSLGRLGHYEMLQVLGKGGFGIVFRAFDETLQRVVAVKVMAPQIATLSPARKRFLREARSSAAVRHENVVQIYEVGEQPLPYLAMEFIPGETLQQKLDRSGPLDVPEVLRIGRQIAEGLSAAHACDLIHRDIKPANVLIEGGPQQRVKITDFGLARAADDASISQSGLIAGTPMYMAPEQALGHKLDQRADLFSLGSVLYQMVAGRPPFRAPSALAVLKRVAEETPRPIPEIIPETPAWLCEIIAKLHAKNPDARFQSAREIADVLADCEAQLKAHAKIKDFSRIPRGKPRRSGGWKWVAATLVLFALVGVGLFALTRPKSNSGGSVPGVPRPTAVTWGEVTDPLGDCRFAEADGRLTITVPGDRLHDLNPLPGCNLNSPRVLREVAGDFEARVTVLPYPRPTSLYSTGPHPAYVGAGLVVWSDEAGILRLFRAYTGESYVTPEWYNGLALGGQKWIHVPDGPLHLRIRRTGDTLHLGSSTDGQTWTGVATVTNLRPVSGVRVGVAVINAIKQEFTVQFEGFKIKELPPSSLPPSVPTESGAKDAKEAQEASAKQLGVPVETVNSTGMKLRLIPPGKFMMGSSKEEIDYWLKLKQDGWYKELLLSEGPQHEVEITQPFYLGQTDVTVGQFRQFVKATGYQTQAEREGGAVRGFPNGGFKEVANTNWLNPGYAQTDDHPVVCASWNDAVEFCQWLSKEEGRTYRLPTEAEWEYSCRAGSKGRWSFGDNEGELWDYARVGGNSQNHAWPVAGLKANAWGLYDMHGNVEQWCQDLFDPNYYKTSPPKDPPGPAAGDERVARGGFWLWDADVCRSAMRNKGNPAGRGNFGGFRVVLVVSSPKAKTPPLAVGPFTDADLQRIAGLPAAQQVEEVRKELKRRNPGFDGKMETKIERGVVTEFKIVTDKVTDIAPIRVFNALRVLDCNGTWTGQSNGNGTWTGQSNGLLADLTPLEGMNLAALTYLGLSDTKVTDAGMVYFKDCKNLTGLALNSTQVTDAGMACFKDCKNLTRLLLAGSQVSDAGLANFKDCKNLTELLLYGTQVGDAGLAHFKDCKKLTLLVLNNTKVSDAGLAYFRGAPLTMLSVFNTAITDLTPLQGMPLEDIRLTPKNITRGLDILRDMKSLKTIGIDVKHVWPAAEFWERYDKGEFKSGAPSPEAKTPPAIGPFTDADVQRIAAQPAAEQVEEVRKELVRRNPGFDGKLTPTIDNGVVTGLQFLTDDVDDVSPVRALTSLQALRCNGSGGRQGRLSDLSPLKGMPLTELHCDYTNVSDLSPLKGMPLTVLNCGVTKVSDLSPLKDMKLTYLSCGQDAPVSDLSPLKGMPLTKLYCDNTKASDLSPLRGMPLTILGFDNTKVSDLTPLKGLPLEHISLTPKNVTKGLEILRDMKSLKTIGVDYNHAWPAAEFWERYDKGEFKE